MTIFNKSEKVKVAITENGRTYFTKEVERRVFFILTLVMMAAGILYKIGVL